MKNALLAKRYGRGNRGARCATASMTNPGASNLTNRGDLDLIRVAAGKADVTQSAFEPVNALGQCVPLVTSTLRGTGVVCLPGCNANGAPP